MTIQALAITDLRHFEDVHFTLHPFRNIICGVNGVGKTTFLEAIYLLSCARSFRSHEINPLVRHNRSAFTIHATLDDGQTIAIEKRLSSPSIVKINDTSCHATSIMSQLLPAQLF